MRVRGATERGTAKVIFTAVAAELAAFIPRAFCPHHPLTPALSPSDGEREEHRTPLEFSELPITNVEEPARPDHKLR